MFVNRSLFRVALLVGCTFHSARAIGDIIDLSCSEDRCVSFRYDSGEDAENPDTPALDDVISECSDMNCDSGIDCDSDTRDACITEISDFIAGETNDFPDGLTQCQACIEEAAMSALEAAEDSECGAPEFENEGTESGRVTIHMCMPFTLADGLEFAEEIEAVETATDALSVSCCTSDSDDICFSSVSEVWVELVGRTMRKTIKDLQVGDRVLTGTGKYEPVYTIDHKDPNKRAKFVQIYSTEGVAPLEVTEDHMVFLYGKESPLPAKAIQVGDALQSENATPSIVTKISSVVRKGVWNPITADGTIAVDGIVASTYSVHFGSNKEGLVEMAGSEIMSHHDFAHFLLTPYRALCLGLSLSFCETKEEFNGYSQLGLYILNTARAQSEFVQGVILSFFISVAFMFQLVSLAMNPLVITGLVLATGTYIFCSKKN